MRALANFFSDISAKDLASLTLAALAFSFSVISLILNRRHTNKLFRHSKYPDLHLQTEVRSGEGDRPIIECTWRNLTNEPAVLGTVRVCIARGLWRSCPEVRSFETVKAFQEKVWATGPRFQAAILALASDALRVDHERLVLVGKHRAFDVMIELRWHPALFEGTELIKRVHYRLRPETFRWSNSWVSISWRLENPSWYAIMFKSWRPRTQLLSPPTR